MKYKQALLCRNRWRKTCFYASPTSFKYLQRDLKAHLNAAISRIIFNRAFKSKFWREIQIWINLYRRISYGTWLEGTFDCCDFTNYFSERLNLNFISLSTSYATTDDGHPEGKSPSLHGRKLNPNPKYLGTAKAYFVCHIGPNFQISLIYAFIGCP